MTASFDWPQGRTLRKYADLYVQYGQNPVVLLDRDHRKGPQGEDRRRLSACQETFIAYGRSERPVFFGAPDGQATRHFFLICSTDHEQHLQILSRLAMMAHATEFLKLLDEEVASVEQVVSVIRAAEEGLFRT